MQRLLPAGRCNFAGAWSPKCICLESLPAAGADGAAVWQRQQQRPCWGTVRVLLWVLRLARRFGLQQDVQAPGCEQRRCGVSKDTLAAGETFLGSQIGKGFSNQPVCISVGFLTGIFQGTIQLCSLQRWCRGQEHPSYALYSVLAVDPTGEGAAAIPPLGKCRGLCVCPVWQTSLIPEICLQDCPGIAQTLPVPILLPSGKAGNFSQSDLVNLWFQSQLQPCGFSVCVCYPFAWNNCLSTCLDLNIQPKADPSAGKLKFVMENCVKF